MFAAGRLFMNLQRKFGQGDGLTMTGPCIAINADSKCTEVLLLRAANCMHTIVLPPMIRRQHRVVLVEQPGPCKCLIRNLDANSGLEHSPKHFCFEQEADPNGENYSRDAQPSVLGSTVNHPTFSGVIRQNSI